ncbi:hypothetical protein V8E55_005175 [Tylopilus felleus]
MPQHIPVPTLEAFASMPSSPMLTGMYTFHINDDIVVISEADEEWHARLLDIRVQRKSKKQEKVENIPWLQVQWYHNKTHVKNQKFAQYVGKHELILSQDKDFVEAACLERTEQITKFDERSPFGQTIGPTDMYMRWKMDINETKIVKVGRRKNTILVDQSMPVIHATSCINQTRTYSDTAVHVVPGVTSNAWRKHFLQTDQAFNHKSKIRPAFQAILRMPIQRGGNHGVVGNGKDIMAVWKVFEAMKILGVGRVPEAWRETISAPILQQSEHCGQYNYYHCTACNEWL